MLPDIHEQEADRDVARSTAEGGRQPLAVRPTSRRPLEAELIRFPRIVAALAWAVWSLCVLLPPSSRVRRMTLRHYTRGCFEALNRGDLEAAFALYHPNVESSFDARMVSLGIEPVYRGRTARFEMQQRWNAEWGDWQFGPRELIDLADSRVLVTGHLKGTGLSSGIAVEQECDFMFTLSAGLVTRERIFLDHNEALRDAGLAE